jgi:hypothetical protein
VATYGKGCQKGDPRLCSYDVYVTNREADQANRLRNASIGLGVTAAVLGAAGLTFVLAAPKETAPAADEAAPPPKTSRFVSCGPGGELGIQCAGTF